MLNFTTDMIVLHNPMAVRQPENDASLEKMAIKVPFEPEATAKFRCGKMFQTMRYCIRLKKALYAVILRQKS